MAADGVAASLPANVQVVLDRQPHLLGLDSKLPLNRQTARWKRLLKLWGRAPVFAGRYFGSNQTTDKRWVKGELESFRSHAKAESVDYVAAFHEPGQHRVQGLTRDFQTARSADDILKDGAADARSVHRDVEHALAGGLVAPRSGFLFVFLDVEWQYPLHPLYWRAWSAELRARDVAGTTLLPCVYNLRNYSGAAEFGDHLDRLEGAFAPAKDWDSSKHCCFAVAALAQDGHPDFRGAVDMAGDPDDFPAFSPLVQPKGAKAPVVLWQHGMNVMLAASMREMAPGSPPPTVPGADVPNVLVEIAAAGDAVVDRDHLPPTVAAFRTSRDGGQSWDALRQLWDRTPLVSDDDPAGPLLLRAREKGYKAGARYAVSGPSHLRSGNTPGGPMTLDVLDVDLAMVAPGTYTWPAASADPQPLRGSVPPPGLPITDFLLRRTADEE